MTINSLRRYLAVALPFVGSAILLYSCKAEHKVTEEQINTETLMTEYSEDLSIQMSENGLKSYSFSTPLMEGYAMARDPYKEFRKGVKVIMYEDDSTSRVSAT
ncbi:MAG: cell division protein, partial [Alistipes sp.]|nr:cell division protein [Alistipes sp.]